MNCIYFQDPAKFEIYIDKHSGEDSGMRIRKSGMWREFVMHQEDLLQEREVKLKFIMAENTGRLDLPIITGDRSNERYVFNAQCILNSKGKRIVPVDTILHPSLSLKMNAPMVLKPLR